MNGGMTPMAEDAPTGRRATLVVRLSVLAMAATALAGIGAMVFDTFDQIDRAKYCPADGLVSPDGQVYGRDPAQDCQFVDEEGRLIDLMTREPVRD
jgi:hypothetical protein